MAVVLAVNSSAAKGVPKENIKSGYFVVKHGLKGDAHAADWHRQVSMLGSESVEKVWAMGLPDLTYGAFAENLTTEGIVLYELPVGTKLRVGEALMQVTQIGKECHLGCSIRQKTGDCVMPREGIFAVVLEPGWIHQGDEVEVVA
jgi:MOSC domain-containing protein YiiM